MRQYDSFVLRCWQLGVGEQRIEVEHLQSGRRTRAAVLTAAVDWMTTQCDVGARTARARSIAAEEDVSGLAAQAGAVGDAATRIAATAIEVQGATPDAALRAEATFTGEGCGAIDCAASRVELGTTRYTRRVT
jgi:hypothetical protein